MANLKHFNSSTGQWEEIKVSTRFKDLLNTKKLTADQNYVNIGITNYNPVEDVIFSICNSTWLQKNEDYIVNGGLLRIESKDGSNWIKGDTFNFVVLKNVDKDAIPTADGSLIQDGSITIAKLATSLQNYINKIGDTKLTTIADDLSGAVNDINSQLSEMVYNVKNYGAKGDGTTDDTVAIQSAINDIEQNYNASDMAQNDSVGATLFFPKGLYKISASLYIKAPIHILGASGIGGTKIYADSLVTPFNMVVLSDTTQSVRTTFDNIRFKYIPSGKCGIYAPTYQVDLVIKNCWFDSWGATDAIGVKGSIADCLIDGCVFEHLSVGVWGETHCNANRIVNCMFYKTLTNCIRLDGLGSPNDWQTKAALISNCHFDDFADNGTAIYLNLYTQVNIIGNTAYNGGSDYLNKFVWAYYSKDVVISGNNIYGLMNQGVHCQFSQRMQISNNIFKHNISSSNAVIAILLTDGSENIVTGNHLYDFGLVASSQGILCNNENRDIVSNNHINDVQYGIILTGSTTLSDVNNNIVGSNVTTAYQDNSGARNSISYSGKSDITYNGDINITLSNPSTSIQYFNTTLTANRTVSLSSGAATTIGKKYRIIHNAGTSYTIAINTATPKVLSAGQWVEVMYDGTTYNIIGNGSL